MHRTIGRVLAVLAVISLVVIPVSAIGAGSFEDVPDGHVFKADIDWLASVGVTKGCNPPGNTKYCPDDYVTRGQMAAFLHRLALGVVDATTVDGMDAAAFAPAAHGHDGDYLEYGEIVMAVSGSNWRPTGGGAAPLVDSFGSYVSIVGVGFIELGLDAPVMIGTVDYRLKSVEVCYELANGAFIDQTGVMVASVGVNQSFIAFDDTDRSASGCHTLNVSASTPNGASVRLRISDGDGGLCTLNVYGVRAMWEPEA